MVATDELPRFVRVRMTDWWIHTLEPYTMFLGTLFRYLAMSLWYPGPVHEVRMNYSLKI